MPFFSIVIPAYNRERQIGRAIDSVLSQDFTDFEIVVTDDASRDRTPEIVREYMARDGRVRLVRHEVNRGVCPARNSAVDAATASWIVYLDSDDELAPGALAVMAERARSAEPDVGVLRFACRWDDGSVSPYPWLNDELWDYAGHIRFMDRTSGYSSETIIAVRRETRDVVRWPDDRAFEGGYHLDLAQRYRTRAYGDVARLYHSDADNSSTFAPDHRFWLRRAPDMARAMVAVLQRHGGAIRKHGPVAYRDLLRSAMKFSFLAGNRLDGIRYGSRALARGPLLPRTWIGFLCGLIHPVLLARIDAATIRMRLPVLPGSRK